MNTLIDHNACNCEKTTEKNLVSDQTCLATENSQHEADAGHQRALPGHRDVCDESACGKVLPVLEQGAVPQGHGPLLRMEQPSEGLHNSTQKRLSGTLPLVATAARVPGSEPTGKHPTT